MQSQKLKEKELEKKLNQKFSKMEKWAETHPKEMEEAREQTKAFPLILTDD